MKRHRFGWRRGERLNVWDMGHAGAELAIAWLLRQPRHDPDCDLFFG